MLSPLLASATEESNGKSSDNISLALPTLIPIDIITERVLLETEVTFATMEVALCHSVHSAEVLCSLSAEVTL